jgi:hypothetical protein
VGFLTDDPDNKNYLFFIDFFLQSLYLSTIREGTRAV